MSLLHSIVLFLVVAGAVSLMMDAGLSKGVLELRRAPRTCRACGRTMGDCRCRE
jgi:hypothetical protein